MFLQECTYRFDCNMRRTLDWKTIHATGNGGKSDASDLMLLCQIQTVTITRRKQMILTAVTAMPHRPNGMNHPFYGKAVSFRDFRLSRGTAAQACPLPISRATASRPVAICKARSRRKGCSLARERNAVRWPPGGSPEGNPCTRAIPALRRLPME